MTVRRRLLAALGGAAVVAVAALPWAGPAAADPTAKITDVTTQQGVVQYLFSVNGLANGEKLDPKSVVVTAGGQTLTATSSMPDASQAGQVHTPPRVVILTFDTSGSMQGDGIAAARSAAKSYVRSLPTDVKVGLVTFSDQPHVVVKPTGDRNALINAINGINAAGNTALYDAIVTASGLLTGLTDDAVTRLVILSDGDDTSSSHTLNDAINSLSATKTAADVVAFRLPGNQGVLNQIASKSRGKVLAANAAGDLAGAFASVAQQFDQQVLVTVQVPSSLADTQQNLMTSLSTGSRSVTASVNVQMPDALGGSTAVGGGPVISAPTGHSSKALLWLITGIAFLAFLVVALVAVWIPAASSQQAKRNARIAEVNRYQLVGALGAQPEQPAAPDSDGELARRALAFIDKTVRSRGKRDYLLDKLSRAGLRMRPEEWIVFQVASVVVPAAVLGILIHSIIGVLVGGVVGYAATRVYIDLKISRRSAAFMDQLPDTLQLIAGSLRSGFSLNQAIVGVVREGSEPTAGEFSRALTEVRLGADLEDALDDTARRMSCKDLHWVVMAVRISREVGGNLAEVLANTVGTMRERAQVRGQVRVLSAEGRISARILIGLPFLLAGFLLLFKRPYLRPLIHTSTGLILLVVGSVLLVLGAFWINRIVKSIEV